LQALDNITELTNNAWYQTAWDVTTIVNNAISQLAPSWVNNWTLTIQKNSTSVWTFTANQAGNSTVNITVPTTVAELSDASDYATKADVAWDLADYVKTTDLWAVALSNDYNDLNNKPTIPTVNDATLTIQKNSTNVATFTANASSNVTANISVPTTVAELSDASDYATKTDLNSKIITAATAPQNPTEWMLWYDTVNDVLKTYDWTNWNEVWWETSNVKMFTISWYWDTTTWQEIYNYYNSWKTPFVRRWNLVYKLYKMMTSWTNFQMEFSAWFSWADSSASWSSSYEDTVVISGSNNVVDYLVPQWWDIIKYLAIDVNYSTPYTPLYNGSPATKKYVDDIVWDIETLLANL
jgi:hypothetical protein